MRKYWLKMGVLMFWCAWPALWVYLHGSKRTRLLLICKDEFLVLRGWLSSGHWSLPGGGLHQGEEPLAGLMREVKEETGIELAKNQYTFLFQGNYREFGFSFVYDCFVAELAEKPTVSVQRGEIVGYAWQQIKNPNVRIGQDIHEALERWLNKG